MVCEEGLELPMFEKSKNIYAMTSCRCERFTSCISYSPVNKAKHGHIVELFCAVHEGVHIRTYGEQDFLGGLLGRLV